MVFLFLVVKKNGKMRPVELVNSKYASVGTTPQNGDKLVRSSIHTYLSEECLCSRTGGERWLLVVLISMVLLTNIV